MDGTRIIAYCSNGGYVSDEIGIWWWEVNPRIGRGWFTDTSEMDDYELEQHQPTYWMPRPEKP